MKTGRVYIAHMIKVCHARYNREVQELPITKAQNAWCQTVFSDLLAANWQVWPLKVEASHRAFYRVADDTRSFVLMTSPPTLEQNEQFVLVQRIFARQGLPVPSLIKHDMALGLFVLSDLGPVDLDATYTTSEKDVALQYAIDTLHKIQAIDDPAIPGYTHARLTMELDIFSEWFEGRLLARSHSPLLTNAAPLLHAIEEQPESCIHRDYHCRNLLFNEGRLGIVDFQDALRGPCLYDLASLLRDCYYTFSEQEVDHWLHAFLAQKTDITSQLEAQPYAVVRRWLDFTAMQRQLKAIGIFVRLYFRDGKASHLPYILPVLARLQTLSGQYEALAPLHLQLMSCNEDAVQALNDLR